MATAIDPYLALEGTARAAMEFYQSILGGELQIDTFGESGMSEGVDPDGIMHAQLTTADGGSIMASDTMPGMPHRAGDTAGVSISSPDGSDLHGRFERLAEGGEVIVAYELQMWGDYYGQLRDQFGVIWHLNSAGGGA